MKNVAVDRNYRPTIKRIALYALILMAFTLVSAVGFVLLTEEPILTEEQAFPEPVILNPEKRPHFDFPVSARTYDLSLNRFVDRFARVCMQGKYSDFRLMLSRRRPPILPPRFESNFNALKQVRILGIEKLPEVPDAPGPIYLMSAEYELQDYAVRGGEQVRQVQVAITREEGDWCLGPIPQEALERLRAYRSQQSTTQAAEAATAEDSDASSESESSPKTTANRPLRIDS